MLDAARLAATAKAAGSGRGWPSSLATRTVTSYLPGGLFMSGTVGVICDITWADNPVWPEGTPELAEYALFERGRELNDLVARRRAGT